MDILIFPTATELDLAAARELGSAILQKASAVIGLSTGRTTGSIHRAFCEEVLRSGINLSCASFFGIDEVAGVDREYKGACYKMLKTEVIDPLNINEDNFLMLPTISADWEADCRAFCAELERRGGIDLIFLGLGENGHLGFNQPGTPFGSSARLSVMYPELEERIRRETATPEDKELGGVTLGLRDIMLSRRLVLAAKGTSKASIVKKMIKGPVTEEVPASVLQLHPQCTILLDREAASEL